MTDERVKELIGELHAILRESDTGYQKADADVKFFDAGRDGTLIVEINGHRYLVMVKDLGASTQVPVGAAGSHRKLNS